MGRLLTYDALAMTFKQYKVRRDPKCAVCGDAADHRRPRPTSSGRATSSRGPRRWPPRERGRDRRRPGRWARSSTRSGTRPCCACRCPGSRPASSSGASASGSTRAARSRTARRCRWSRRASEAARSVPARPSSTRRPATPRSASPWSAAPRATRWSWCMPESVNAERQRLCRAYGARIVFTDAFSGSDGALEEVRETRGARARPLLLRRPVPESGQPARPLPHHGPRDLGADGRADHALRGRARHHGHDRGHRAAISTSATRRSASWPSSPTSRCTASRA